MIEHKCFYNFCKHLKIPRATAKQLLDEGSQRDQDVESLYVAAIDLAKEASTVFPSFDQYDFLRGVTLYAATDENVHIAYSNYIWASPMSGKAKERSIKKAYELLIKEASSYRSVELSASDSALSSVIFLNPYSPMCFVFIYGDKEDVEDQVCKLFDPDIPLHYPVIIFPAYSDKKFGTCKIIAARVESLMYGNLSESDDIHRNR
jgi:hypothetical protein